MFWCGVAAIVTSLVIFHGSHALHVHLKSVNSTHDVIVHVIDVLAIIAFVAGCIAVVVCNWFPDASRNKSMLPARRVSVDEGH